MKVVIIGGGIAGLAAGILLKRYLVDVVICERNLEISPKGNAFLMHSDGLSILEELLGYKEENGLPGRLVDAFHLKRPTDKDLMYIKLRPWQCIKRADLIQFLLDILPEDIMRFGRSFSHFMYENGKAIAAVFNNGDIEYGDVFIAADGGNSKIRELLFGETKFTDIEVKEIVGVCKCREMVIAKKGIFTKYLDDKSSLSFGYIPTSSDEIVWFTQFNSLLNPIESNSKPDDLKSFTLNLLKDFPSDVQAILNRNDFSGSYVWNTRDFDVLNQFHNDNIVLIGDAAHLALPFTSAGTTNAFVDAKLLVQLLVNEKNYSDAFNKFYELRAPIVKEHLLLGRKLKAEFLNFHLQNDDKVKVPLIANKEEYSNLKAKSKKIHILYFTDPVCSTCWIIQPQLRKLKLEYGDHIEVEYCMSGLLPSWDSYDRGGIKQPEDAQKYWENAAIKYNTPINGDIWVNDPLHSSYPPSLAFKAAQIQDIDKAIIFLRRLNEMLFFENKNIVRKEHIKEAAFEVGLDVIRLFKDIESRAEQMFDEDLSLVKSFGIQVLPTFILTDRFDNHITLSGFQDYQNFESAIEKLIPEVQKNPIDTQPHSLFNSFNTLTTREFAFLTNLPEFEAINILQELSREEMIEKIKSRNGEMWRLKKAVEVY
jgi:2-polyprenyl-6-methoxyphenol hydroxylase-like FAD-dependent oxidoreductase/predicted DsbA family dithiol-disulfide isomerase